MGEAGGPTPSQPEPKSISESPKLSLTRRSFLIGAGAGAAAAGAVLGGAVVATKALNPTPTTTTTTTATQSTAPAAAAPADRKSTRLNSSHDQISYAAFSSQQ